MRATHKESELFNPPRSMRHPWVQTILPTVISEFSTWDESTIEIDLNFESKTLAYHLKASNYDSDQKGETPLVILIHGLGGSSDSYYIKRIAPKLSALGFDVLKLNLRNAGPASGMSRGVYHSGQIDDFKQILNKIQSRWNYKKIHLVGYSLGANILLNYLGSGSVDSSVVQAVALSPPVDLLASSLWMAKPANRIFEKYLLQDIKKQVAALPEFTSLWKKVRKAQSIMEFDEIFTAPVNGFSSAKDYYARTSCGPLLRNVEIPTSILISTDDPIVSSGCIALQTLSPSIDVTREKFGGHLGFVSRQDGRWIYHMDHFIGRVLSAI